MPTQVAVLEDQGASALGGESSPQPIPLDVTVLAEDTVWLSQGGALPTGVTFDANTGELKVPLGFFQIQFTIVTPGASFKSTAVSFDVTAQTFLGLPRTSETTAAIETVNTLPLGSQQQQSGYTLLCVGAGGQNEPHDPTIVYEPPGG